MQRNKSLVIFRRDLRLEDNTALLTAMASSKETIAVFFIDPRQVEPHAYRSHPGLEFMSDSLFDLESAVTKKGGRLYFFEGRCEDILPGLILREKIEAIFFNRDYTPFALARDKAISDICRQSNIECQILGDALLNEPEDVRKADGGVYTVFTPFFNCASKLPVKTLAKNSLGGFYSKPIQGSTSNPFSLSAMKGGRQEALLILKSLSQYKDYVHRRDFPAIEGTTRLSAHLKFGTLSVREIYYAVVKALGFGHPLIRQLYWRDFFIHIAFHFPHVFGHAFHPKYDKLQWRKNKEDFNRWCEGRTGFPIVDAGMRELNTTGFMHNRVRMITASFLVKDLHIDWLEGERYFAAKLVDYDPCVNNGNWQWAASTGCDHQPYFRIFNPWLQQKKFDPDCVYIKRWIPELQGKTNKEIHAWQEPDLLFPSEYPAPMLDHALASARAKAMFTSLK